MYIYYIVCHKVQNRLSRCLVNSSNFTQSLQLRVTEILLYKVLFSMLLSIPKPMKAFVYFKNSRNLWKCQVVAENWKQIINYRHISSFILTYICK